MIKTLPLKKASIKSRYKKAPVKKKTYQKSRCHGTILPWQRTILLSWHFFAEKTKSALRVRRHRSPDLVRLPST